MAHRKIDADHHLCRHPEPSGREQAPWLVTTATGAGGLAAQPEEEHRGAWPWWSGWRPALPARDRRRAIPYHPGHPGGRLPSGAMSAASAELLRHAHEFASGSTSSAASGAVRDPPSSSPRSRDAYPGLARRPDRSRSCSRGRGSKDEVRWSLSRRSSRRRPRGRPGACAWLHHTWNDTSPPATCGPPQQWLMGKSQQLSPSDLAGEHNEMDLAVSCHVRCWIRMGCHRIWMPGAVSDFGQYKVVIETLSKRGWYPFYTGNGSPPACTRQRVGIHFNSPNVAGRRCGAHMGWRRPWAAVKTHGQPSARRRELPRSWSGMAVEVDGQGTKEGDAVSSTQP